ncbi:MAG: hypothetical protein J6C41_01675 [Oscillospiraceae bacterium]|nr:hypothetical protein [Oscillospiraceae bacterium]
MLELRAGRTQEDADQEKQVYKNVAQKATMISEKAEGSTLRFWHCSTESTNISKNDVDNEYYRVYNRIKHKEGALTMFAFCFNAVDIQSGNGMPQHAVGLTLSYAF